jgi:hypothetical protein
MFGTARTTLGFEALERKQPLAGDVVVSLVGGNLVIEGDEAGNQIAISSGEEPGSFVIQGLEGTVVTLADAEPGDPPAPETGLVVEGVRGHVRVGLGDGDDTVAVHDAQFRRGLTINTGAGADEVRIGAAEDADPMDPAAEVEDDANVEVRGSLLISTGEDGDTVNVASASVGGLLTIATDGGDDTVNLGVEVAEEGSVTAAVGEDATLRAKLSVSVLLGDGVDAVFANDVATRGILGIGGGDGADSVELHDSNAGFVGIRGGGDDAVDSVALSGLEAHHAAIGLGDGDDEVSIVDSAFSSLAVALGAGDDSLSIETVNAKRALLAGGDGEGDELTDAGDNTFRHVAISSFELRPEVNTDPIIPRIERPRLLGGPLSRLLGRLGR